MTCYQLLNYCQMQSLKTGDHRTILALIPVHDNQETLEFYLSLKHKTLERLPDFNNDQQRSQNHANKSNNLVKSILLRALYQSDIYSDSELIGKNQGFVNDGPNDLGYQNMERASKLQVGKQNQRTKMANYEVIKIIGKGGFSKVLLVRQKSSGKLFAMKIINKEMIKKRGKIKQIMTERNILLKSKHPYIIQLEEAFQSKYHLHLVLEFCPGGELFYHLQLRGRFSEAQTRFISAQIICALEYLHSNEILYRDLKPENVLVDIEGHIKISDFGLSRENFKFSNISDSFCGSPEYISPEMLLRGIHTRMIDFYQLGALLYEMLTGLPPNYSENKELMYQQIMKESPEMPEYLSPHAISLLSGLLQKQPEKRIGFQHQFEELKSHDFYRSVNWPKIMRKDFESQYPATQIRQVLRPVLGRSYFDTTYIEQLSEDLIKQLYEEKEVNNSPIKRVSNNDLVHQRNQVGHNLAFRGNEEEKVQQESDLMPTNRVSKVNQFNQEKMRNDELKAFENSTSPRMLKDQLLQNETIGAMNNVTGSGNLIFGKSIDNTPSQEIKIINSKIKYSSPPIKKKKGDNDREFCSNYNSSQSKKQLPIMQNIKSSQTSGYNFSNPQSPDLIAQKHPQTLHYQYSQENLHFHNNNVDSSGGTRKLSSFLGSVNIDYINPSNLNIQQLSQNTLPIGSGQIPYLGEKMMYGDDSPSFESEEDRNSVSPDYTPIHKIEDDVERVSDLLFEKQYGYQKKNIQDKIFEIKHDNKNKFVIKLQNDEPFLYQDFAYQLDREVDNQQNKNSEDNIYAHQDIEITEQRCKSLTPKLNQHLTENNTGSNIYFDHFNFNKDIELQQQNQLLDYKLEALNQNISQTPNQGTFKQGREINGNKNISQRTMRKQSQADIVITNGYLNLKELTQHASTNKNQNSKPRQHFGQQTSSNAAGSYKSREINEKYTLNLIRFNEKLNNIVSERKRNPIKKVTNQNQRSQSRNSQNPILKNNATTAVRNTQQQSQIKSRNQSNNRTPLAKSMNQTRNHSISEVQSTQNLYRNQDQTKTNSVNLQQLKQQERMKYINSQAKFQDMIKTIKVQENKIDLYTNNQSSKYNYKNNSISQYKQNNEQVQTKKVQLQSKSPLRRKQSSLVQSVNQSQPKLKLQHQNSDEIQLQDPKHLITPLESSQSEKNLSPLRKAVNLVVKFNPIIRVAKAKVK
eukprot:403359044